ncbi:MAG: polymorphic toxin-type HINT domain-containing protein [Caldilineaceae bacterium]
MTEGELVLAYNEATGAIGAYPITDVISHVDPEIVLLRIDDETLETTAEHPFYELESAPWLALGQTAGRWTDALELQAGDRVWQADGTSGVVQSVAVAPVQQRMYNLTVAEAHTFFVGDGRGGLCTSVRGTDPDRPPPLTTTGQCRAHGYTDSRARH